MPTKEAKRQLAPASLYSKLISQMQEAGFSLLYRFTASTDSDTYHVGADYAQETSLYFYLPGKGFIVHAALSEHIDKYGYKHWWKVKVYLQLDTRAIIAHEVKNICPAHREEPRFFMDDCVPLEHTFGPASEFLEPLRYTDGNHAALSGDDTYGWAGEYAPYDDASLGTEQLVAIATRFQRHFAPFLEPKMARRLPCFRLYEHLCVAWGRGTLLALLPKATPPGDRSRASPRTPKPMTQYA